MAKVKIEEKSYGFKVSVKQENEKEDIDKKFIKIMHDMISDLGGDLRSIVPKIEKRSLELHFDTEFLLQREKTETRIKKIVEKTVDKFE